MKVMENNYSHTHILGHNSHMLFRCCRGSFFFHCTVAQNIFSVARLFTVSLTSEIFFLHNWSIVQVNNIPQSCEILSKLSMLDLCKSAYWIFSYQFQLHDKVWWSMPRTGFLRRLIYFWFIRGKCGSMIDDDEKMKFEINWSIFFLVKRLTDVSAKKKTSNQKFDFECFVNSFQKVELRFVVWKNMNLSYSLNVSDRKYFQLINFKQ